MSNAWLLLGVGIAGALQATAMLWPPLGGVLGTSRVSAGTLRFCLVATVATVIVTEATKWTVARVTRLRGAGSS